MKKTEIDASEVQILKTKGIMLRPTTVDRLLLIGYEVKVEDGKKILRRKGFEGGYYY